MDIVHIAHRYSCSELQGRCSGKFCKIHSKTPAMQSFSLEMQTMDLQSKKGFIPGALMKRLRNISEQYLIEKFEVTVAVCTDTKSFI